MRRFRPGAGRRVKSLFTIRAAVRYDRAMLIAALLAISSPVEPRPAAAPQRQAQATVRIVAAAALRFAEIEKTSPDRLRDALIRSPDGPPQPARLVEFE